MRNNDRHVLLVMTGTSCRVVLCQLSMILSMLYIGIPTSVVMARFSPSPTTHYPSPTDISTGM